MTRTILVALAAFALACAGGDTVDDASDTPTARPNAGAPDSSAGRDANEPSLAFPADSGTAGITAQSRSTMEPAILRDVRSAAHDEFDRVVFDFGGGRVPGYHIEYIDRPVRQCGSGEPMQVAGDGWLRVRLEPARAHEFRDDTLVTVTVTDRNRTLTLDNLRQLVLTCDFEAQVEWVLGVRSPARYRVMELANPARLVVDVRH
jgi:hypothetical protein